MTSPEIRGALLKIEAHLENHDQHHADCTCNFCDALSLVQNLRRSLRPNLAEERLEEAGYPASGRPLHEVR